jgi:hypothetical protein
MFVWLCVLSLSLSDHICFQILRTLVCSLQAVGEVMLKLYCSSFAWFASHVLSPCHVSYHIVRTTFGSLRITGTSKYNSAPL